MTVPTIPLMTTPTPVEPAPRLARALGLGADDLLLKREDLTGLGAGGNKVRKLQVAMAAALESGARAVVTTGAAQSNHARLTAAAGARLGLEVVLVLWGDRPDDPPRGNLLLDELFGARLVWAGDDDPEALADELERAEATYRIPYGGSSPLTATAYVDAGAELLGQVPDVRHVVVAVGSGGTMAGLVAALGPDRVLGVHVGAVTDPRAAVAGILDGMPGVDVAADALRIDAARVGAGYSRLAGEVRSALRLAARTEGIVLDPVYTGRALAGLVAAVGEQITPGERTVLLHTGGLPGLFGHAETAALAGA